MTSIGLTSNSDHFIETELKDILTLDSCVALVAELIKFILYRKQQLPYTFDRLKYLIHKKNSTRVQESINGCLSSIERQFKIAENGLATLEMLFNKTKEALADSKNGHISEVALLFGSTPMTPKQVYIFHLPEICLDHSAKNHPERKNLVGLLQSVILSSSLTNMLTKPMNPTNMYVFIKKAKNNGSNGSSDLNQWFTPKRRYEIPKSGQHFHIKFRQAHPHKAICECQHFQIYSDSSLLTNIMPEADSFDEESQQFENCWYQAEETFTGFTDVSVNGVSVANLWVG